MTTMAFLEIRNLKKRFGSVEILKGMAQIASAAHAP